MSSAGLVIADKFHPGSRTSGKNFKGAVVISTWSFGKAANAEAWKTLGNGGRALDAIEAGARVPEADLNNHSVGRAGYPDRDGHVTLD
ncbi:MAG TPA: hypothetical protein VKR32_01375, partial [Puia sp.]|nr:hypothetical protein [Puia sp.]